MTEQQALGCHESAQLLQGLDRHEEALSKLRAAAGYFLATEGAQSPDLANVLADEAESLLALCRYAEAEQAARQATGILEPLRAQLDTETRGTLMPRVYGLWGRTLRELGRYEDAAEPVQAALREAGECFGEDHVNLAEHWNNYGVLCKYWGKFDEGEQAYLCALQMLETEYGRESAQTATIYHNLGGLEHSRGNFVKGEPLARLAVEIGGATLARTTRRRSPTRWPGAACSMVWNGSTKAYPFIAARSPITNSAWGWSISRWRPRSTIWGWPASPKEISRKREHSCGAAWKSS